MKTDEKRDGELIHCCCFFFFFFFFFFFWGGGVTYAPVLGRQAYIINIKCWHCYYIHHHHHYHNPHQLTAVSFVRTVGTVLIAVTHVRLLNTDRVCALPIIREALVLDWTTDKSPSLSRVFTFIVNVFVSLHFHAPVASLHSSLSSLSFVFVITFIQLLPATTVITYKNNQCECCSSLFHLQKQSGWILFIVISLTETIRVNIVHRYFTYRNNQGECCSSLFHLQKQSGWMLFIVISLTETIRVNIVHRYFTYRNNQGECCSSLFHVDYCQLRPTLSSDALISIVSSFINIITSTDHHLFRSHLLSPALFLLIFSSGALFIT